MPARAAAMTASAWTWCGVQTSICVDVGVREKVGEVGHDTGRVTAFRDDLRGARGGTGGVQITAGHNSGAVRMARPTRERARR